MIAAVENGSLEAVTLLIEKGADLKEVEEYGIWDSGKSDDMGTALYKGAVAGMVELVSSLIAKRVNPHFEDRLKSCQGAYKENKHEAR